MASDAAEESFVWVGATETELAMATTKAARALLAGPPGPWAFVKLPGVLSLAPLLSSLASALSRLQPLAVKVTSPAESRAWLAERASDDPVGPRHLLTLLDLGDTPAEELSHWAIYVGRFVVVGRKRHSHLSDLARVKKFLPPEPVAGFLLTD